VLARRHKRPIAFTDQTRVIATREVGDVKLLPSLKVPAKMKLRALASDKRIAEEVETEIKRFTFTAASMSG